MAEGTWTLLIVIISICVYFYLKHKKSSQYWAKRSVAYPMFDNIIGEVLLQLIKRTPLHEKWYGYYKQFPNEKFVGIHSTAKTTLLAKDPEFLEKMMVKDFQHFMDHDVYKEDRSTMTNLGIFSLTGNEWRVFRGKIVPTFTTGKLKTMFDLLVPCGETLLKNIENSDKTNFDIKDDIMLYAIEVTSTVIFGIELLNEELRAQYKKNACEMFQLTPVKTARLILASQFPTLAKLLGIKFLNAKHEKFFKDIITQTFEQRAGSNLQRNDYIQLLLKLKEKGSIEVKQRDPDDDYLKSKDIQDVTNFEVTDDHLAGQAFQFLSAGFEPVYNTMVLMLIEIAQNQEIQEKLRNEIKEVKEKHGGYTYSGVREMSYMEQCLHETLRKHPVLTFLIRNCVKEYKVNESLTIEKGTKIMVSVTGIHRDPAYYPDPDKFDPERFSPDGPPKNFTYLPFGGGPRICIGMRFAMMEIKYGIAKIIETYSISLGDKATIPVELDKDNIFLSPVSCCLNMVKLAEC